MSLRQLARRLLGVRRVPTYYVPWVRREGLRVSVWRRDEPGSLLTLDPSAFTASEHGFLEIKNPAADVMVAVSNGDGYTATHGRNEFIEYYPWWVRAGWSVAWRVLRLLAVTVPAFTRDHMIAGDQRLLVLNLSNLVNLIRVDDRWDAHLYPVPAMGSAIIPCPALLDSMKLTGNAWFNFYVMTESPDGAVALQHVK